MGRLALRALQVFGAYAAVPATVVAWPRASSTRRSGLWATILWGCVVVIAVVAYAKRRLATE